MERRTVGFAEDGNVIYEEIRLQKLPYISLIIDEYIDLNITTTQANSITATKIKLEM